MREPELGEGRTRPELDQSSPDGTFMQVVTAAVAGLAILIAAAAAVVTVVIGPTAAYRWLASPSRPAAPVAGAVVAKLQPPPPRPSPVPRQPADIPRMTPRVVGGGTGFVVSHEGHVVTAWHVVSRCDVVTVDSERASVLFRATHADLAVLKLIDRRQVEDVARLSAEGAALGEPVMAVGYPLPSQLGGGLNVTMGNVSSLAGFKGEQTDLQFSARVLPGNSGGPILDERGHLIGVVHSVLSVSANAGFGLKGKVLERYLRSAGVPFETAASSEAAPGPVRVSERAARFTKRIACWATR
ncbi:MAG: trypsin-like peptidase domain-containing protein [Alphaproteobacteria bacterium]|nr:trypsin-like peptidase domain-containing protein [Alphaproteobacteria bacterium]